MPTKARKAAVERGRKRKQSAESRSSSEHSGSSPPRNRSTSSTRPATKNSAPAVTKKTPHSADAGNATASSSKTAPLGPTQQAQTARVYPSPPPEAEVLDLTTVDDDEDVKRM